MGTPVVDHVRTLLRDLDRPLTARERCLMLASIRSDNRNADAVELLDVARRAMRYRIRATGVQPAPELVALLAAVDGLLDEPGEPFDPAAVLVTTGAPEQRAYRADLDG